MAYTRVNWKNGTKTKEGYTIVNGETFQTVQPEYIGNTPVNADNLNIMDEGIAELDERVNKSCMRMYLSSQYSYTSNAAKKLTLTKDSSQGSKLTVSDGGVKIGAGITHVFVSGQVYFFTGSNHADGKLCLLYKNDTVISATHNRQSYNYIMVNGGCIIPVSEGDVIYLYCKNDNSSNTTVIQNGKEYTYLNVIEI